MTKLVQLLALGFAFGAAVSAGSYFITRALRCWENRKRAIPPRIRQYSTPIQRVVGFYIHSGTLR